MIGGIGEGEVEIEARRRAVLRMVGDKGSDGPHPHLDRERAVRIREIADGKPPGKDDALDGLVPRKHPVGEVLPRRFHAELAHDGTPAVLFRPHPERQRARGALAVVGRSFPAARRPSGLIGDLPVVKFSVREQLDGPRSDPAERDSALLLRFRHNDSHV